MELVIQETSMRLVNKVSSIYADKCRDYPVSTTLLRGAGGGHSKPK